MSARTEMDRRSFIELLGGGILVVVGLGPDALAQQRRREYPTDLNAYLRIGEDGRVTVFSSKIEMGQGVMTSLAQMVAEELGVGLGSIDMVMGDTERCVWDGGTFGSLTTRFFGPALRAAGAEARAILLQLASERLAVPGDRLAAADGVVSVKGDPGRQVTYGQLAKGQAIARTLDAKAVLHSVSEFRVMGGSPHRLDARDKVTGAAKFAGDVHPPGLLYARLLRPPAHGAKRVKADTSAAARLPGVTVVNERDLVAVLHADPEAAEAALERVVAEWTPAPPGADQEGIFDELLAKAPAPEVAESRGTVDGVTGARRFAHTYRRGYVAHAPIEPHAATATFEGGRLTVWASTQTPFPLRDRLASLLELDPSRVRVITRSGTALLLRQATANRRPMPDEFVDMIWRHFDRGTRRAILELYRSTPEHALAAAGSRLDALRCPALVAWGARDPYLPVAFARLYAQRLGGAELVELPDAGHWPWIERPDLVERVVGFLDPG